VSYNVVILTENDSQFTKHAFLQQVPHAMSSLVDRANLHDTCTVQARGAFWSTTPAGDGHNTLGRSQARLYLKLQESLLRLADQTPGSSAPLSSKLFSPLDVSRYKSPSFSA
jgi:hypothetical protein